MVYDGNVPCFIMPLEYLRTKVFADLCDSRGSKMYFYLRSYIIRGNPIGGTGKLKLYEDYYKKGYLVSKWSQEKLAEVFDVKQPTISKYIKSLEEKGYIQKDIKYIGQTPCNIYIIGTHDGKGTESFFLDEMILEELRLKQLSLDKFEKDAEDSWKTKEKYISNGS